MEKVNCFEQGQEIKGLYFKEGGTIAKVGLDGVEKIVVGMEYGQMAGVPWFNIWVDGKVKYKYNAALIECVELF